MSEKFRIPITAITVFGTSGLLALTVGIVLFLGFGQTVQTTRLLWAGKAQTLIDSLEQGLDSRLLPVRDQADWVARDITDLSDPVALDPYFFGVLAATPHIAGVAVIKTDGRNRRWHRAQHLAIADDWSQKPWFADYVIQVKKDGAPSWREPIYTDTINSSTLLHDTPLYDQGGEFIGIFAQIIPLQEISSILANSFTDAGVTPFILYNRQFVLAHPRIVNGSDSQPLPRLDALGDSVLPRIWTPDEDAAFISSALLDTQASGVFSGDDYYLYLYRDIGHYGPAPWTIGAYINTSLLPDDQTERALRALTAGLVVLGLAIVASILAGRKVSSPVQAIVHAADAVERGDLGGIEPLSGSHIRELDDASRAFNNMVDGLRERKLIRDTLGRFVPQEVASSLLAGGGKLEVRQREATILFCDIEAFTRLTEILGPVRIVEVLNAFFSRMVEILERFGGVVTQFQGDAILATFNVPIANPEHSRNAVQAARAMLTSVAGNEFAGERLQIRIGINTGKVVAGAIGAKGRLNYTVHGDAVNLAARLEAMNKDYGTHLLLAEAVASRLPAEDLKPIGETTARGQTQSIRLFTLASLSDDQAPG